MKLLSNIKAVVGRRRATVHTSVGDAESYRGVRLCGDPPRFNEHDLAVLITHLEGKRISMTVAQVTECLQLALGFFGKASKERPDVLANTMRHHR